MNANKIADLIAKLPALVRNTPRRYSYDDGVINVMSTICARQRRGGVFKYETCSDAPSAQVEPQVLADRPLLARVVVVEQGADGLVVDALALGECDALRQLCASGWRPPMRCR